jgi:GAF domain-containing protein
MCLKASFNLLPINQKSFDSNDVWNWLKKAQALEPQLCDWIGIYIKEEFLLQTPSSFLVLGPFLGEPTEHVRISISKGICGMAIREERAINVADVRSHPEHIACSLKTRSELVIPLKDHSGVIIAELDIDSNTLNAFSPEIEKKFQVYAQTFAELF